MKAGRELDALVAEKVMGLRMATVEQYCQWLGYGQDAVEKFKRYGCLYVGPDDDGVFDEVNRYSTDITAAWQVLDSMKRTTFEVYKYEVVDGSYRYGCTIGNSEPVHAYADTAPLAISIAALKAVGVEVPS